MSTLLSPNGLIKSEQTNQLKYVLLVFWIQYDLNIFFKITAFLKKKKFLNEDTGYQLYMGVSFMVFLLSTNYELQELQLN